MDNLEDKVVKCLNPECGRDSCRMCKLSNHIPLTCEEYIAEMDISRRRVEEELTMSWVRQCWNCKIDFERVGGCSIMTCPKCANKTCYTCRKPYKGGQDVLLHRNCNRLDFSSNTRLHEKELKETEEKIKRELREEEKDAVEDLFKPSTSKQ